MALTREDYRRALHALLPPGQALPADAESRWQQLLEALAGALARVDARAAQLLEEADPRTTYELLPDWERVAGLPDPCVPSEQTVDERRAALLRVLTSTGGQSRAYFIDLAASLGFEITIEEHQPHTVGDDVAHAIQGDAWRWAWTVRAPEETVTYLTVAGAVPEPLATWGNERLECVIERSRPAHTNVLFAYG